MTLALAFAGALSFAAFAGAQTDPAGQAGAGQSGTTSGQTAGGQSGTGVGSGTQTGSATGDNGQMGSSGTTRMDKADNDQRYLDEVAGGNLAEIQLSQLAVQKAQDPQVKQFAQTMVDEHTKAKDQVQQVASASGISLPTDLDSKHQKMQSKLSNLTGSDFDKEYMKLMVSSHKEMEGLLKKKAGKAASASASSGYGTSGGTSSTGATGTSGSTSATSGTGGTTTGTTGTSGTTASSSVGADVNSLASQLLPEVQQHLQQAKDIEKQLGQSGKSSKDNSKDNSKK